METPVAGLALDLASHSLARRSPFSPSNTITTGWQSDPSKTNDLLSDIAKVLHTPVPSPQAAGLARRLEGNYPGNTNTVNSGGSRRQSAKDLVASLDALLEKSPSADLGRAAVQGVHTGPSPRPSLSLAPESGLRRSGSSSSIANEVLALLERQPSRSSLSRAVSFKDIAASPSLSAEASVASLLDQITTVTSPRGSFATPPAALLSSPAILPEASFGPAIVAAATVATSPVQTASDASQQLRRSPSLSSQAALDFEQQQLLRSPSLTPLSPSQAAARVSTPLARAPSGIPGAAGAPPSPALPGLGSPRLSRMGSFSSKPSPLGPFSPRGSLVEPSSPTAFLALGSGQLKTGGSPPSPRLAAGQHIERVVLQPLSFDLQQGHRFLQEASNVLSELAAFAQMERSATARFQAKLAEQLNLVFRVTS